MTLVSLVYMVFWLAIPFALLLMWWNHKKD